nr:SWI/SNF-related matrix-associated actin-dependent regulator of chromatin subfamily D member 3-like [Anolis sagrei ordinatus]
MDLLAFERKLDQTIMRKRVDIQEALKRPMKQKRKLRLYISNTFNPAKSDADDSDGSIASWELRVEGKLLDDLSKQKRKFSSFFKSLVIELDKDLYGPDNHLVEWHRTPTTQETDGFQVKRPGDVSVRCTLLLMLDYQVGLCGSAGIRRGGGRNEGVVPQSCSLVMRSRALSCHQTLGLGTLGRGLGFVSRARGKCTDV